MSAAPDVTVIVPTYNTEPYLDQCLTSIRANERAALEVLVINDGSTDGSLKIMRRHEELDPRIRVIDKPNGGYGSACNRGLTEARGIYVAIVEPDDFLLPGFYDEALDYARSFPEPPQVVKTPYVRVTMPGTPRERAYHCSYFGMIGNGGQPFTLTQEPRLLQYHPSIWSALYLRSFLQDRGIRFMEAKGGGWVDNPFLAETLAQAQSIVFLNKEFYCYREDRPGSSSMLRATDLAFTRWNDMTDILDRLGCDDRGVRMAHAVRGISYLSGIIEETDIAGTGAESKMLQMFRRIDPEHLLENRNVSNQMKLTYCRAMGIPADFDRSVYRRALVNEFFRAWKVNGPLFALTRVKMFLARRMRIGAHDPTATRSAGI